MWWLRRSEVCRWIGGSLAVLAVVVLAAGLSAQYWGRTADVWQSPAWTTSRETLREGRGGPQAAGQVQGRGGVLRRDRGTSDGGGVLANFALLALLVYLTCFSWKRDRDAHRSALAATLLPFAMLFAWCILIPFAWLVTGVPASEKLGLSKAFQDIYQILLDFILGDLPLWFMVLGVMAAAGGVAGVVWWWQKPVDSPHKRLIVAWWILAALAVACFALPLLVFAHFTRLAPYLEVPLSRPWQVFLAFVLAALPFLPIALKAMFPPLRTALDLVFDVVTHFQPRYPTSATGMPRVPHPHRDPHAPYGRAGVLRRPGRAAKDADGEEWHVVIVSHSQGTMAVLSGLNDPANGPALAAFASLRLVTMGSPFSHIYQHYFRHHYPSLADPQRWGTLHAVLDPKAGKRWLNVYRVDDYVGRRIEDDGKGLVENVMVAEYGHTNYWSDGDVMGVLVANKVF